MFSKILKYMGMSQLGGPKSFNFFIAAFGPKLIMFRTKHFPI